MVFLLLLFAAPALAQRQAQLPWWDRAPHRQIGPYWIKTDLPPEEANAIARHLNVMHREFDKRLASVPVRVQEKLEVYIFRERAELNFTLRTRFAVQPREGGFFVSPSGDYGLAFTTEGLSPRQIEQFIQREGFRQFAYNRFGDDLPPWLDEGLVDLFGDAVFIGETLFFGQSTPETLGEVRTAIENDEHIPLRELLTMDGKRWKATMKEKSPLFMHRQARSLAVFAMQNSESFTKYVRHLNNGLPANHAFARSFGDTDAFESRWKQFAMTAKPGAMATAMERIEFLAEGMLELSRRQQYPLTLDELKSALRAIEFRMTRELRHGTVELSADDDALFTIPMDELCPQQPIFIVTKTRLTAMPRREQVLERDNPTPPTIATQNLRPSGVQVRWVRDQETNTFSYQIVVR